MFYVHGKLVHHFQPWRNWPSLGDIVCVLNSCRPFIMASSFLVFPLTDKCSSKCWAICDSFSSSLVCFRACPVWMLLALFIGGHTRILGWRIPWGTTRASHSTTGGLSPRVWGKLSGLFPTMTDKAKSECETSTQARRDDFPRVSFEPRIRICCFRSVCDQGEVQRHSWVWGSRVFWAVCNLLLWPSRA